METRFDAIVIGAGPSGSAAAYNLAKAGFNVLMIERGRRPGAKNMFGGRVYKAPVEKAFDDLDKAPIHRWVVKERISVVYDEEALTIEYDGRGRHSFTTYLTDLSSWMADKAVSAGAKLITEVVVDRLLVEDGWVKGIISGDERLYSDVVIDCEGVNRLVLEKSGFVEPLEPDNVALGFKEVLKLSKDDINKFFGLEDDEGLAWVFMGEYTEGIPGGGFLYTNRDSVSLGLVIYLGYAAKDLKSHVYDLMERVRLSRIFNKYFRDARVMEYSAHMIPADIKSFRPKRLVYNGLVIAGDAGGFLLNLGYTYRGVDLAAYTGYLAANTISKVSGEYSQESLSIYEDEIEKSFVGRDLKKFSGVHTLYENRRLFREYPILAINVMRRIYNLEFESTRFRDAFNQSRKGLVGLTTILKDLWGVYRNL
ncbi:MAG TPA: FAD-dependent oxidoreductase [Thermoprotei archaeon]|nr:FAD-dependent oxidoreductase [Thermoprotei archaeon]